MPYTNNSWLSGLIAGTIVAPLVYVFDVGKIRQQTSQSIKLNHFWNSYGKWTTLHRETIAMSLYFGTYFTLKGKRV